MNPLKILHRDLLQAIADPIAVVPDEVFASLIKRFRCADIVSDQRLALRWSTPLSQWERYSNCEELPHPARSRIVIAYLAEETAAVIKRMEAAPPLFIPADICSAFEAETIGSKVIAHAQFLDLLAFAVSKHDTSKDRIPGQMFIRLEGAANNMVSCGVGRPINDPDAFVLKSYRGKVSAFLRREFAAPTQQTAVVLYTLDAALNDPDATTEENERLKASGATYVIVAVLATAAETSALSPHRFVANLAGGNHEAQVWTADEIRAKAKEIISFDNLYATVADA